VALSGSRRGSARARARLHRPRHIRWIRSSHLLLYGRLEIASALAGEPVLLDIEFNAVGWRQKDHNWRNMVAGRWACRR
jgi:hypothetical protein